MGGLGVLTIVVLVAGYRVASLDNSIAKLIRELSTPKPFIVMQTYSEVVTTQSGRVITVVTTRLEGESAQDFAARHNEAVEAARKL